MPDALTKEQLEEFRSFALKLAHAASKVTLPLFRKRLTVENKYTEGFDPVTQADQQAETEIRKLIEETWSGHDILGEEYGATDKGSEFRWVLDPVDGTRAFICGVPSWTTLIALEYQERPVVGVISQPYLDEHWAGMAHSGGTVLHSSNAQAPVQTTTLEDLAGARLTTTDPRGSAYFTAQEASAFDRVAQASLVQRFGLDAYGYALLASGQFDLAIEAGLQRYDAAALIPVVEGAGGVVSDWSGSAISTNWELPAEENGKRGQIIAAASPTLRDQALELLSEAAL